MIGFLASTPGGGVGGAIRDKGSENLGALKRFMADPNKMALARATIKRPDAPPLDIEPMEQVVPRRDNFMPWALLKEQAGNLFDDDDAGDNNNRLEHPLAHMSDPRRMGALLQLSKEQWSFIDNAHDMCSTARALAAERARIMAKRQRNEARIERTKEPRRKYAAQFAREVTEARRSEKLDSARQRLDSAHPNAGTSHDEQLHTQSLLTTVAQPSSASSPRKTEGSPRDTSTPRKPQAPFVIDTTTPRKQLPLSARSSRGEPSRKPFVPLFCLSARSSTDAMSTARSRISSSRTTEAGQGILILTPRGTNRRLWTPRGNRTPRFGVDHANMSRWDRFSTPHLSESRGRTTTPRTPVTPRSRIVARV